MCYFEWSIRLCTKDDPELNGLAIIQKTINYNNKILTVKSFLLVLSKLANTKTAKPKTYSMQTKYTSVHHWCGEDHAVLAENTLDLIFLDLVTVS